MEEIKVMVITFCYYVFCLVIGRIIADKICNFFENRKHKKQNEEDTPLYKLHKMEKIDAVDCENQDLINAPEIIVDFNKVH